MLRPVDGTCGEYSFHVCFARRQLAEQQAATRGLDQFVDINDSLAHFEHQTGKFQRVVDQAVTSPMAPVAIARPVIVVKGVLPGKRDSELAPAVEIDECRALRVIGIPGGQTILGREEQFPNSQYPLLRKTNPQEQGVRFNKPINVLLIFIEGLDRRYLGHAIDLKNPTHLTKWFFYSMQPDQENESKSKPLPSHIKLTPFLDRLGKESIYFKNFFSNGDMTARALFSTLCSYYPRRGWSVMRARYTHEFCVFPKYWKKQDIRQKWLSGKIEIEIMITLPYFLPEMAFNNS